MERSLRSLARLRLLQRCRLYSTRDTKSGMESIDNDLFSLKNMAIAAASAAASAAFIGIGVFGVGKCFANEDTGLTTLTERIVAENRNLERIIAEAENTREENTREEVRESQALQEVNRLKMELMELKCEFLALKHFKPINMKDPVKEAADEEAKEDAADKEAKKVGQVTEL